MTTLVTTNAYQGLLYDGFSYKRICLWRL